jgi:AcrR family transcriptional regulator
MRTDDERERIFQAAATVWRDDPALPIEAVAKLAHVSRATVYRYTGGRRALLDALGAGVPDDARARILAAAMTVLVEVGVHKATVANIAAAADVAPVTVYRIFGDRAGLLAAVSASAVGRRASTQLQVDASDDVHADLASFVRPVLSFLHDNNRAMLHALVGAVEEPALFGALHPEHHVRTVDRVAAYLDKQRAAGRVPARLDAKRAAVALFSLIAGFAFLAPSLRLGDFVAGDVDGATAHIVDVFLGGITHG